MITVAIGRELYERTGSALVVLCVALIWPEMRRLGALSETAQGLNET